MSINSSPLIRNKNNFDFIRFIAASLVILSHSFPLTGNNDGELLLVLSNKQTTIGTIAVDIFFIISGFLITQSFFHSRNIASYFKARILRIFPGLIFAVLFTVFVIGPIFTTLPLKEYLTHPGTYKYLIAICLKPMQHLIPGLFETNPYNSSVNGSLWTLQFEFIFYIVVGILGILGFIKKRYMVLLFFATLVLSLFTLPYGGMYILLFTYFGAGMVGYLFKDKLPRNKILIVLSFIVLLLTLKFGYFNLAFAIFGSYLIFMASFSEKIRLYNFSKYGDFSYGIYIFAFPIQQTITYLFDGNMPWYLNFLIAYPVTLLFAMVSWNLVEKNALKLKKLKIERKSNKQIAA